MVSWVFKLGFWTHPIWCLDQLDIVFAWGVALFLLPSINHKSNFTTWGNSWLVWGSQSKKVCSSWFLSWNTCDVHAVRFFWPSVLITCPKFDNLLPELELSISVPFVLMLQIVHWKRLASDGLALGYRGQIYDEHPVPLGLYGILAPQVSMFWSHLKFDSVPDILQYKTYECVCVCVCVCIYIRVVTAGLFA